MTNLNNKTSELKERFNFMMDEKTRKALEEIVEFSGMSASSLIRKLILREARDKTLEG